MTNQKIKIKALELAIESKKSASEGLTNVLFLAKEYEKYIKNDE